MHVLEQNRSVHFLCTIKPTGLLQWAQYLIMTILKARRAGRKNAIARLRFPAFAYPEYAAARNESSPGADLRRSRAYRSCFASADRAWGIESSTVRNLSSDGACHSKLACVWANFLGDPCGCPLSLVRLIGKRSADRNPKHRQGRHCLFRYGPERAACGSLRTAIRVMSKPKLG